MILSNNQTGRLQAYTQLTRLDRPIGIYLLLWPTLWGLWFAAEGIPSFSILIVFIFGTILMRSAGCAINDYADRDFDGNVARTQNRPLPTGRVSPNEALIVALVLAFLAFLLVLTQNQKTIELSIIAVFLATVYPFCKRITHWPQIVLGAAFAMSIPMGYAAITKEVPNEAWLLFVANILWTLGYDTMYAMADKEDDLKIGIKSTAIALGRYDILFVSSCQFGLIILLLLMGYFTGRGLIYFSAVVLASGFVFYQLKIIKGRDPKYCFKAFLNNHYVGLTVFFGLALDFILF